MRQARISIDHDVESPFEWDHVGVLANDDADLPEEPVYLLPFYFVGSSDVSCWVPEGQDPTMWTGCFWFDDDDLAKENMTADQVFTHLDGLVDVYSQWMQGHCWYVEVWTQQHCECCGQATEKTDENSCGGFIGEELEFTGILEEFDASDRELLLEAWEKRWDNP